jgi:hypothetical protein
MKNTRSTAGSQHALVRRWRSDADAYMRQAAEAQLKGPPYDHMIAMSTCLRACANELETAMETQSPNASPSATPNPEGGHGS